MVKIPKEEFAARVEKLKVLMREKEMQACLIYGDEYRKENLRYMSNYWPLFERGAVMVPLTGEPFVIAAPEGEMFCREMSAWPDIRLLPEFACVTVPDKIEYPQAHYTSLTEICQGIQGNEPLLRLGIVGIDAMPEPLMKVIEDSFAGIEVVDAGDLLFKLRMTKTANEVACLQEAARIADAGYKLMIEQVKPGMTELELASLAYGECTKQGAENIPFCLLTSGERVNTIIGRASGKVIEEGDMIMAAIAIQVEGYVATMNFPFVAGRMSEEQKAFIDILVEAEDAALNRIKAGAKQNEVVRAVKAYFKDKNVTEYDLYPPLHGCGLAEAESPYPDENSEARFVAGMTVNTDVSLFGHPHGSNRIEESLLVTETGYESMSKLVRHLSKTWKETATISVN
ncbi:peptidase M24 [Paenibacillus baekrokdamisoli]|uniref:Peptidase M24 n=1 Tax=Paenibacillus baekrokdamisoli TaxID=1712516 RepID=A0A3G9IIQ7_9BACL|nr:Xaa-Pro peptidase family protein [Paenibacillus baekrokdamisoli]MBB3069165.1 Xaa-Pro aminopeptidase [Paenibacillus baekrokdamisoli]BBH18860.1 peptidase M24 [Paenibacillus baekrokdamisoli]